MLLPRSEWLCSHSTWLLLLRTNTLSPPESLIWMERADEGGGRERGTAEGAKKIRAAVASVLAHQRVSFAHSLGNISLQTPLRSPANETRDGVEIHRTP